MRALPLVLLLLALAGGCGAAAPPAPEAPLRTDAVRFDSVVSEALQGNPLGDDPAREAVVYLPPGYGREPERRYPTVYLLHGFDGDARQFLGDPFSLPAALDSLIGAGRMPPMIVVMPDGRNALGGSFFVDSPATGLWENWVADDLVAHVDARYRTLAAPASRGVAGWSMGGYGALSLAMRRPDRFGAVYALSPCCLGPEMLEEYGPNHPAWAEARSAEGVEDAAGLGFHARLLLAVAAALAPGEGLPEPDPAAVRVPTPEERVAAHRDALLGLRGIGIDAGTRDGFRHIPRVTRRFAEALEAAGIPHRYEAYDGTHGSRVPERLRRVVLPFFGERLAR